MSGHDALPTLLVIPKRFLNHRHSEMPPVIPNLFRNLIHTRIHKNALLGGVDQMLNPE